MLDGFKRVQSHNERNCERIKLCRKQKKLVKLEKKNGVVNLTTEDGRTIATVPTTDVGSIVRLINYLDAKAKIIGIS